MSPRGPVSVVPLVVAAGVALVLTLGAAGCGSPATPAKAPSPAAAAPVRDLLARVPADTPYLMAEIRPAPDQQAAWDQLLREGQHYLNVFAAIAEAAPDELAGLEPELRVLFAAAQTFAGRNLAVVAEELGFARDARSTLYGRGMWPVLRIELADGRRLRAGLGQVLARARVTLTSSRVGDAEVWRFDAGELGVVIAAIEPRHATIALVPAAVTAEELLAPPADVLDLDAVVDEIAARTGLRPDTLGFVDVSRLLADVVGLAPAADRGCVARLVGIAGGARRLVFASTSPSDDVMVAKIALDLDARARAVIGELVREIPHWPAARDPDAMMDMGIGLDVGAAIHAATDAVEAALATPACAAMRAPAGAYATWRALAAGPVGTITGGSMTIYELPADDGEGVLDAVLAVSARDPLALLRALEQQLGSPLTPAPIVLGGPPVESDLDFGDEMDPVIVAAAPGSLLVSTGELGGDAIAARRAAPGHRVLYALRMDSARQQYGEAYDQYVELAAIAAEGGVTIPAPRWEDYARLGEASMEARLDDRGVVVDFVQRYRLGATADGSGL